LNGTHQLLVCAGDVNLLRDNIVTIKKNVETLIDTCNEVCLEVNTEKGKYMVLSPHQNAGQNLDIKIDNRSFENTAQFRYLGTTITNQNVIHEEMKSRLSLAYTCYHSVQNLVPSCLLSKNLKIEIYKIIIMPVVLYGCETWSHIKERT
jgi:hypothetical protein